MRAVRTLLTFDYSTIPKHMARIKNFEVQKILQNSIGKAETALLHYTRSEGNMLDYLLKYKRGPRPSVNQTIFAGHLKEFCFTNYPPIRK